MIKILINNEEVVCNNNISIKEEMLSTSSTILKNCYPKSWENDKNYTSRYYFPQDYSKCKIINDEPIDFEIVGETTQTGTPTPDSPKPIINKSGIIQETIGGLPYTFNLGDIELCKIGNYQDSIKKSTGKNLLDMSNLKPGYVKGNGPINPDDSTGERYSNFIQVKPNTQYTFKIFETSSSYSDWYGIGEYSNNDYSNFIRRDTSGSSYITFTTSATTRYVVLSASNLADATKVQFELGNQQTSYEPYLPQGTWYVEKKIGYTTYTGTETWIRGANNNYYYFYKARPSESMPSSLCLSNYFKHSSNYPNVDNCMYMGNNNIIFSRILTNSSYIETTTDFNDWLSTHETILYYVLASPTYTEITDPTLLEQLNNVGQRLVFCGCVKNTGNISLNPREPHFVDLQLLDFKLLLSEGETLNYVITGKTIVEAINQVVNSISDYGFIVGNIEILNPDDIINAYSTLNKTAYDVFQYIADITQSRWTTRMIDENTIAIDFYDPTLMPTASPIQSTQAYYENNKIIDISFNYSTNDYRNKQIMTSDEVFANITQTETLIADGYTQNFMCQNKLGTIETITVNGVSKTFATKSEQALGITADFYYQPGEIQFSSANTISTGSVIIITYYAIVKGREIILNTDETSRIETQINRKGSISRYENRNDTTSSQELQKIGQTYIKYKGKAEINLKVKTRMDLFNVGQIVEYQAPLEELSTEYMVKSKEIDWYAAPNETFYIYELTSNFNYENAVNYFDNQRAKSQGNLDVGQTITRNIDIENKALIIFYDTEQEEIEPINPSSLDFALDGVLI